MQTHFCHSSNFFILTSTHPISSVYLLKCYEKNLNFRKLNNLVNFLLKMKLNLTVIMLFSLSIYIKLKMRTRK